MFMLFVCSEGDPRVEVERVVVRGLSSPTTSYASLAPLKRVYAMYCALRRRFCQALKVISPMTPFVFGLPVRLPVSSPGANRSVSALPVVLK